MTIVPASLASLYTDPGSGALLWQALAGTFFGCLFYLRKIVNFLRHRSGEPIGPATVSKQ